jgi:hypothetical protein
VDEDGGVQVGRLDFANDSICQVVSIAAAVHDIDEPLLNWLSQIQLTFRGNIDENCPVHLFQTSDFGSESLSEEYPIDEAT